MTDFSRFVKVVFIHRCFSLPVIVSLVNKTCSKGRRVDVDTNQDELVSERAPGSIFDRDWSISAGFSLLAHLMIWTLVSRFHHSNFYTHILLVRPDLGFLNMIFDWKGFVVTSLHQSAQPSEYL